VEPTAVVVRGMPTAPVGFSALGWLGRQNRADVPGKSRAAVIGIHQRWYAAI